MKTSILIFALIVVNIFLNCFCIEKTEAKYFDSKVVAIIGNIPITSLELNVIFDELKKYPEISKITSNDDEKKQKLELLNKIIKNRTIINFAQQKGISIPDEQMKDISQSLEKITNSYLKNFLEESIIAEIIIQNMMKIEYKERLGISDQELINYKTDNNFLQNNILIEKYSFHKKICKDIDLLQTNFELDDKVKQQSLSYYKPSWVEIELLPEKVIEEINKKPTTNFITVKNNDSCDVYILNDKENTAVLDSSITISILNSESDKKIDSYKSKKLCSTNNGFTKKIDLSKLSKQDRTTIIKSTKDDIIPLTYEDNNIKAILCDITNLDNNLKLMLKEIKDENYRSEIIYQISQYQLIEIKENNIF